MGTEEHNVFDKRVLIDRLKKLRGENSQKSVADKLQIKQQLYSKYETGERNIPIDMIYMMAKTFNVPSDYLIGLTDSYDNNISLRNVANLTGLSKIAIDNILSSQQESIIVNGSEVKNIDLINQFIESDYLRIFIYSAAKKKKKTIKYDSDVINLFKKVINNETTYDITDEEYVNELKEDVEYSRYKLLNLISSFVDIEYAPMFQAVRTFVAKNNEALLFDLDEKQIEKIKSNLNKLINDMKEQKILLFDDNKNDISHGTV